MSIKEIICWVGVGLITGLPIGFFIGNKSAEREYREALSSLEDSEAKANAKVQAICNLVDKELAESKPEEPKSLLKEKPDLESLAKKYNDKPFTEHVAAREHPEEDEPEEDIVGEDDIPDEDDDDEVSKKMTPPYEIDQTEMNDYPDFTRKDLTYYMEDDILSDKEGCMYSDRKSMLGNLVADALPGLDGENRIFVANEERQTIFIVNIDYESSYYKESVKRYV